MIEIIYKDSAKDGGTVIVKPPKNIRQIGSPRGRHKIYMEDYVYTFLHSAAFEGGKQKRAAVLLGKSEVSQDIRYTFISSAILCEDFIFREEGILFDESCWEYIYKEIKQYFDGQDIVGWFLGAAGFPLELSPAIEAAHRKYFAGRDKVLFLSEPSEGEDLFFAYEQGILQKKEGYYIYYEKNLPMQEYMVSIREQAREREGGIETRIYPDAPKNLQEDFIKIPEQGRLLSQSVPGETSQEPASVQEISEKEKSSFLEKKEEETENQPEAFFYSDQKEEKNAAAGKMSADEAIRKYRSMLQGKKAPLPQRRMSPLLYMAAAAAMVILCVIGITTVNNYEKMQQVEQVLSVISGDSNAKQQEDVKGTDLVVTSIPGEVTQQEEKKEQQPESEGEQQTAANQGEENQKEEQPAGADENPQSPTDQEQSTETGNQPKGEENQGEAAATDQGEPKEPEGQEGETQVTQGPDSQKGETSDGQEGEASEGQEGETSDGQGEESPEGEAQTTAAQAYLDQGYYIVQPGDKLELICKKIYNTTAMLDKLCEINGITDVDKIFAGQKLVLP